MPVDLGLTSALEKAIGKPLSPGMSALLADLFDPTLVKADADRLQFADGTSVPVRGHVPRFVPDDDYADSFSFQWLIFTDAQVDSAQKVRLTEDELRWKSNLTPDLVRGKAVLDAGVGTGRHAEVLAEWGAEVVGVDLSRSVDSAYPNLARFPNAAVIQANLGELPFQRASFDIICSMGVLHHTPDTKEYTRRLLPFLKPGGMLTIWLYSSNFARRKQWVPIANTVPHRAFFDWSEWIVDWLRDNPEHPLFRYVSRQMPFAFEHPTRERSVLALFDGYTPTFHGVHTPPEVIGWFQEWGLADIKLGEIETSVSGRKPG